jgi:flagellar hook protein FlgE
MGLASALSTALTGLNGAETTINVVGNNLANSSTDGFKASEALFATQFLQTLSLGSQPSSGGGGTNPTQIGLGVQVASITPDFSQGTIQLSNSPSDLAIQGSGFFVVQSNGQQVYTRNGSFQLNSANQLATSTGEVLLGYGINSNYQLNTTAPTPLSINLGAKEVAQATQNVSLQGTLTPTGDLATNAAILDSSVLGDAAFAAPTDPVNISSSAPPNLSSTTAATTATAGVVTGTVQYKITFADNNGEESPAATLAGTVTATNQQIDLTNVPVDTSGNYTQRNIYRSDDGGTTYFLDGTIGDNTTTTFTDNISDATLTTDPTNHPPLDSNNLNGNYTYRITWSANDSITPESRPSPPVSVTVTDGRLVLSGFDTPPVGSPYVGGKINIYRNVAGQPDTFYRVGQIPDTATSFTDSMSDAEAADTTNLSNFRKLDLDGPTISTTTLLDNVLSRSGNTYNNLFQNGTLSFTGVKGGDTLGAKTLTITNTTTVQNLMDFMQQSLGIRSPTDDPQNPIPNDGPTGKPPGISINSNGEIEIVSNVGTDNAIGVPLSAFKLTPTGSSDTQTPILGFSTTQAANGQSAAADFVVYDSLGIPLNVRVTTELESRDSSGTTYRWYADSPDNDPATGAGIAVGTGLIKFDGNGNVVSTTNSTVSVDRAHVSSDSPLQFNLDFSDVSGLAADSSSLAAANQDGSAAGTLTSYNIGNDGTINGVFSNGVSRTLGQVLIAGFGNPEGLVALGNNDYAAGVNSGLPQIGAPGTSGRGSITAGAVELSNTDIGKNLIQLILASTAYQGNTRVISTVDNMLQVLLTLNR